MRFGHKFNFLLIKAAFFLSDILQIFVYFGEIVI